MYNTENYEISKLMDFGLRAVDVRNIKSTIDKLVYVISYLSHNDVI